MKSEWFREFERELNEAEDDDYEGAANRANTALRDRLADLADTWRQREKDSR